MEILVHTSDPNATYIMNDIDYLNIGKNIVEIEVTAENGNIKKYTLVINREELSNNANMKLYFSNKEVIFNDSNVAEMDVSSKTNYFNYEYKLEDEHAVVKVVGTKKLKHGKNNYTFIVIAEDGTENQYHLIINKKNKLEEITINIIGIIVVGVTGYSVYYFITKLKKYSSK